MENWFIGWPTGTWSRPPWPRDSPVAAADALTPVAAADQHVTLAFLGACGEPAARSAWAVARGINALTHGRPVHVTGWAVLGRDALVVRVDDADHGLHHTIAAWRDRLRAAAGLTAEDRPPLPHVTVARLRQSARIRKTMAAWATGAPAPGSRCLLSGVALYTRCETDTRHRFRQVAHTGNDAEP